MEAGLKKAQCNHRQKEIRGRDMSWKIGNVRIENPFVLAPMAGVTDMPFRTLCKEQGAGLICMEMISAKAISFHNKNTIALMKIDPCEHPVSMQLFGSEPELMAEVAKSIEDKDFDILDINMGCPVPKVVNNGEGSALLKNPELIVQIIKSVSSAIQKPVTVKVRICFENAHCGNCQAGRGCRGSSHCCSWQDQTAVLFRHSRLGYNSSGQRGSFYSCDWKWRCRFTVESGSIAEADWL